MSLRVTNRWRCADDTARIPDAPGGGVMIDGGSILKFGKHPRTQHIHLIIKKSHQDRSDAQASMRLCQGSCSRSLPRSTLFQPTQVACTLPFTFLQYKSIMPRRYVGVVCGVCPLYA